jgi:hypothetical protein
MKKTINGFTKKQCIANHKKVWNKIIKLATVKNGFRYLSIYDIKEEAFYRLGIKQAYHLCFGCECAGVFGRCDKDCLFDLKSSPFVNGCLDGMYDKASNYLTDGRIKMAIRYFIKIRDFPIKK